MKQLLFVLCLIFPFVASAQNTSSYSYDNPAVSIATEHTNYFFKEVENPFSVVVEDIPCAEVYVESTDGILEGDSCQYTFTPKKGINNACFNIYHITDEDTILIKSLERYVRDITEPIPFILGKRDCKVDSTFFEIDFTPRIYVGIPNQLISIHFVTLRFSVMIYRDGKPYYWKKFKGNKLPEELMAELKKLRPGDEVVFYDIYYSSPIAKDELLVINFVYFEVVEKSELRNQPDGIK